MSIIAARHLLRPIALAATLALALLGGVVAASPALAASPTEHAAPGGTVTLDMHNEGDGPVYPEPVDRAALGWQGTTPAGTTFASVSVTSGAFTCSLTSSTTFLCPLPASDQWVTGDAITFTYRIDADQVPGTIISGGSVLLGTAVPVAFPDTLVDNPAVTITKEPSDATVVSGSTATFTAGASNPGSTAQWFVSTNGGSSFSPIPGATGTSYTTGVVTLAQSGTKYGVEFLSGGISADSRVATLTVIPSPPVITAQPADATVPSGGSASFSAASTSDPAATVQWQSSSDSGSTWTNIPGATGGTYATGAVTTVNSGTRYRAVFTNSAATVASSSAILTVTTSSPVVTVQPVDVSTVSGTSASFSAASTSDPAATVQWQSSTNAGMSWTNVPGATGGTYVTGTVTTANSGTRYRAVFSNPAAIVTSTAATLTVTASIPVVVSPPADATVPSGSSATFAASSTSDPAATVQWQSSTDSGASWANISGATAASYATGSVATAQSGTRYRAVFTNAAASVPSLAATLTVTATVPVITTQPADATAPSGSSATFSAASSADPAATVQWQSSTDSGASWANISGATAASYATGAVTTAQSGTRYRAVFTNAAGSVQSSAATLTVTASIPVITTQPADATVPSGSSATFSASSTSDPAATVQWQSSTNAGISWANISGATSASYTTGSVTTAQSDTRYRAVFTNAAASVPSSAATLTVTAGAPLITTQPADATVPSGSSATFSASSTSDPAATVQWQSSTNAGISWANISGATNATYATGSVTTSQSGTRYRAVFTNAAGSTPTSAATLTVTASVPVITTQPADATVPSGSSATFSAASSADPAATVQWQSSTDSGATWANISGATAASYTTGAVTTGQSGTRYRALFTNAATSVPSTAATLTVTASAPVITTQPADATVPSGASATFSAASASDPAATVQWQSSTDAGATWADIAGATGHTFTTTALSAGQDGTKYRAVFTNPVGSITSAPATVTVTTPAPVPTPTPTPVVPAGLALTGFDLSSSPIGWIALLLLLAGSATLIVRSRLRPRR
jgi:hypothetical protein